MGVIKKAERLELIMQKLRTWGGVSCSELSEEFHISTVTVRKDLELLESRRLLTRVAGGAVLTQREEKEERFYSGKIKNETLKRAIAKKAAELIEDGDSLIVTCGMTPYLTLGYAKRCSNLKIVTESLEVAENFCSRPDYQVVLLGGKLDKKDSFTYGATAMRQVNYYMADKAIVTMDGVDLTGGLTTIRREGTDVLRTILQRGRMRILVADITKIGKESLCRVEDASYMDILVTNSTKDPKKQKILRKLSDAGIRVIYADEA